jgi:hypothetical protein
VPPFVSVLVVNYNGRPFLADCLTSLRRQSYPRHRFETIVVDNASTDGSAEFVLQCFPEVRVLRQRRNLGFAGGNNAGFEKARGEWVALLNSDAVAEPGWLLASVAAGRRADIGGVAGHVVFAHDNRTINSTGLELYRDGRGGDRDFNRHEPLARPGGEVFGGCGAALVLRRTMLEQVGFFRPDLFMYYEDLELAWRARRAAWRFVYAPAARVRHAFGASAGVHSPLQTRYVERNRGLVNLLHAPVWLAAAAVLGSAARVVRAAWRRRAFVPHSAGFASMLLTSPKYALDRWTAGGSADGLYRRWARPRPR